MQQLKCKQADGKLSISTIVSVFYFYFYQLECTQIYPKYLYIETGHWIAHKACKPKSLPKNTFLKSQIYTQTLTPPKNNV